MPELLATQKAKAHLAVTVYSKKNYEIIGEIPNDQVQLRSVENDWVEIRDAATDALILMLVPAEGLLANRFYRYALDEGVYFHASWHHGFSQGHTREDLAEALDHLEVAARRLASEGA